MQLNIEIIQCMEMALKEAHLYVYMMRVNGKDLYGYSVYFKAIFFYVHHPFKIFMVYLFQLS